MVISNIIVLSLSIAYACAGYSQFYVTPHFASHISPALPVVHQQQPLAPQISQNTIFDIPSFYHAQPVFFSQNVNPFIQNSFSLPQPQVTVEQARSNSRQGSGRSLDSPQSDSVQGVEYGFGYRTQFQDGASSTVVFVSGPDSKKMNLLGSNKFTARKLASDILDVGASNEKNEKINEVLSENNISGLNFDTLIEAFPDFKALQHQTGVVHLFSHPANVFPIPNPVQTLTSTAESTEAPSATYDDAESVAIESADNEPSARSNDKSEKEAESIIQETKIRIDEIKNRNEESSTENSSEASSPSSESTSTEGTTVKGEEIESTTQL